MTVEEQDIRLVIVDTIFEAGHHTVLLDALCGAAEALGKPEIWHEACATLGYEPHDRSTI